MPFNVNPISNQNQEQFEQKNTGTEPVDLGQSRYDFRYLVFPNDLGMDDNGHYMVINMNVPTKGFFGNVGPPAGQYTNQFTTLNESDISKVDKLRYGATGSLYPIQFGGTQAGDRGFISIPRRTRRIAESVALHMPSPLVFNTHNAYEEISMSALAGKLGSIGISAIFAATGAVTQSINKAINIGSNAKRISDAAGQGLSTVSKVLQSPMNPAVEILFANTLVRQFTLEVLMAPRNEQESISMKSIIKTLRFHGAPEISDVLSLFWIPPAEFDITFFNKGVENMNILRINTCVLERIEVDYAPTGVYSTFRNGHPVAVRLSMGFRELEPVHKKRILQGF